MIDYCVRCGKRPRGEMAIASAQKYSPFCSYACQQYSNLDSARAYLASLPEEELCDEHGEANCKECAQ